jgi:Ca2+:H+ antiporter
MEALALFSDKQIHIALSPTQTVMTVLTLVVTAINLHDGETNAIEGLTHLCCSRRF